MSAETDGGKLAKSVICTVREEVAVIKINSPGKENVLNGAVIPELTEALESIRPREDVKAIVIMSSKPGSFLAGADINMLGTLKSAEQVVAVSRKAQERFQALEKGRRPVVAAIMGTCMGGGVELSLACQYRLAVASERTMFSLPEVRLGLLPGAGGTQRLPQLVSLPDALQMMLTGRPLNAERAKQIGLVDQLIDPIFQDDGTMDIEKTMDYLEDMAIDVALRIASKALVVSRDPSLWRQCTKYFLSFPLAWNWFVKNPTFAQIRKLSGDLYPAPYAIFRCVEAGFLEGPTKGFEVESEEFGRLSQTSVSKALIHLFHASTACRKQRFGKSSDIRRLAVVGSSEIATGLAYLAAEKGLKVSLIEDNAESRNAAHAKISQFLRDAVRKGRLTDSRASVILAEISVTDLYTASNESDLVLIAAAASSVDTYKERIAQVEECVSPSTPIAVQSFGGDLEEMTSGSRHPERILGIFYTAPVHRTEYVEIVAHQHSTEQAIATAASFVSKQKKVMLLTRDGAKRPGYYLIHCLLATISEVCAQVVDGHLKNAADIDSFTKSAGFFVGLATVADHFGLVEITRAADRWSRHDADHDAHSHHYNFQLLNKLIERGRLGKSSGGGFHKYVDGKAVQSFPDDEWDAVVAELVSQRVEREDVSVEERKSRLIQSTVNEASDCLKTGLIETEDEGDVGCVFGIGFPANVGGPFWHAKQSDLRVEHSAV